MQKIKTINLALPFHVRSVNCYLIETDAGYFLIDTGAANKRLELQNELESAGCKPGNLKLIIITHGDFDHTGNAAYLRETFASKIVMHVDDRGMAERADMFWNRSKGNALFRKLAPILIGFGKADRFTPDLLIEDEYDLSGFGFQAIIISIAGHSKGSIGILTASGDLFCGDLLENTEKPALNAIMDNPPEANVSVEKLRNLSINTVYPGHGKPFPLEQIIIKDE